MSGSSPHPCKQRRKYNLTCFSRRRAKKTLSLYYCGHYFVVELYLSNFFCSRVVDIIGIVECWYIQVVHKRSFYKILVLQMKKITTRRSHQTNFRPGSSDTFCTTPQQQAPLQQKPLTPRAFAPDGTLPSGSCKASCPSSWEGRFNSNYHSRTHNGTTLFIFCIEKI